MEVKFRVCMEKRYAGSWSGVSKVQDINKAGLNKRVPQGVYSHESSQARITAEPELSPSQNIQWHNLPNIFKL